MFDSGRRELHVEHGGTNVGVSHQVLKGGQRDAGANHIRPESVSKTVRIGTANLTAAAVMAEQRAESGDSHRSTALGAL